MYTNELYHHGIKGMHWGVRRYQNSDGTYTSAGKARRNDISKNYGNSTNFDRKLNRQNKKERISAAKNSSQLSDDELNYRINRLQKEKQLKDLTNQTVAPGRKRVKDFLARNAETITGSVLAAYVTNKITRKANKPSYDDMVKDEYTRQKAKREAENRLVDEKYYVINKEGKMKRKYETRRK